MGILGLFSKRENGKIIKKITKINMRIGMQDQLGSVQVLALNILEDMLEIAKMTPLENGQMEQ